MRLIACALLICFALEKQDETGTAQALLKEALGKAKEGKKHVLLTFGSPG